MKSKIHVCKERNSELEINKKNDNCMNVFS